MKRILFVNFLAVVILAGMLSGCGRGSGSTSVPAPPNYKAIGNGAVVALTSLRDSFVVLVAAGKASQSEVDAINSILVVANEANKALQETTFPPPSNSALFADIERLAKTAANIAGALGVSSNAVVGINLAIAVFESIRSAIGGGGPVGAASAPVSTSSASDKLRALQRHDARIRRQAGR
jgi:hypothetical protein